MSPNEPFASLQELQKLDLRVGTIVEAHTLPDSHKLMKLLVDIGEEKRQIVAGIGDFYGPTYLKGKRVIIAANLQPKTIMNTESNGMLLAANFEGPVLLHPDKEVPSGTRIT